MYIFTRDLDRGCPLVIYVEENKWHLISYIEKISIFSKNGSVNGY